MAKSTGTIEFWKLNRKEQQEFHKARYSELKALLDLGAMRMALSKVYSSEVEMR